MHNPGDDAPDFKVGAACSFESRVSPGCSDLRKIRLLPLMIWRRLSIKPSPHLATMILLCAAFSERHCALYTGVPPPRRARGFPAHPGQAETHLFSQVCV